MFYLIKLATHISIDKQDIFWVKEPHHIHNLQRRRKKIFLNKILYQAAAPFSTSSLLMSLVLPSCSQCHQDLFFATDAKGEQNWPIALKSTSGLYYNQGITLKGEVSVSLYH
jgi:hypothetical protein